MKERLKKLGVLISAIFMITVVGGQLLATLTISIGHKYQEPFLLISLKPMMAVSGTGLKLPTTKTPKSTASMLLSIWIGNGLTNPMNVPINWMTTPKTSLMAMASWLK